MCFSRSVTNPVLLLSSLGSTLPETSQLQFSVPYVVLYDGGGMVFNNSTTITGTEGCAIIMFPGNFTCVTISSTTTENYTNLTWGIRPQPFAVNITDVSNTNGSTTVTANGGATYQWNGGDTPNQATNTFHQSGTYLVTVTDAAGCTTSLSKVITVNNNVDPVIETFLIPNQTTPAVIDQANHTIRVTMPPGTNVTSLVPIYTVNAGTTAIPALGNAQNFTNPVNYVANNTAGQVTYTVTVNVIVPNVISVCPGFHVGIDGLPMPGVTIWQIEQNGVWVNAPGTYDAVRLATTGFQNTTGTLLIYHIRRRLTQTDGSVMYDTYYDLVILPSTDQNIISATNPAACFGESNPIQFTGTQPLGYIAGATYRWEQSTDDATWQAIPGATQQNYTHTAAVTQKTFIRRYTGVNACGALSNTIAIEYNGPVTTAIAGQAQTACSSAQFALDANAAGTGETGSWSVVSPINYNPFTGANINNPKAVITNMPADVDVQLKWTISKNNCSQFSESLVTVRNNKAPAINAGADVSIEPGNSTTLQGNITSNSTYTYQWSPATGLNDATLLNPVATPAENTVYTLTATNDIGGCTALDQVAVYVNNDLKYPNTFTPNGDGFNDLWNIKNVKTYNKLTVSIMNRWGAQIFYSNGYAKPWDGTYKGKKVPAGVYYYVIDIGDTNTKKSGSVTVIY